MLTLGQFYSLHTFNKFKMHRSVVYCIQFFMAKKVISKKNCQLLQTCSVCPSQTYGRPQGMEGDGGMGRERGKEGIEGRKGGRQREGPY